MEFCPKCDTHMEKRIEQNNALVCPNCGFKEENKNVNNAEVEKTPTMTAPQPPMQSEKTILEVTDTSEANPTPLPTTDISCPNCGNTTAYWWMAQTRSADEPSTQFFRCVRCNHTWRNYE